MPHENAWHVPIQYTVAAVLHAVAAVRIVLILRHIQSVRVSTFLITLFANWLTTCVLLLPYEIFGAVMSWRPEDDGMRDGNLLFGLGMPPHVFGLSMLPISVFYLTLERITIIHLAGRYGDSERRRLLGCYGASLVIGVAIVSGAFASAFMRLRPTLPCVTNGCMLGVYVKCYLGWRAICAIFNFSAAVLFFDLFYQLSASSPAITRSVSVIQPPAYRYNRSAVSDTQLRQPSVCSSTSRGNGRINRLNNLLTIWVITSEFFLSFLPHFGPFVWEQVFGEGSSTNTGPLSEFSSAIEVTVFTVVYGRIFEEQKQQDAAAASGQCSSGDPTEAAQRQWQKRLQSADNKPAIAVNATAGDSVEQQNNNTNTTANGGGVMEKQYKQRRERLQGMVGAGGGNRRTTFDDEQRY